MSSETNKSEKDKILERNKIKEEFKFYLENAARSKSNKESGNNKINLGPSAVSSYLNFIEAEKLFDYNPNEWKHIESIYDIIKPDEIESVVNTLMDDKDFIKRDNNNNSKYRSNALKHYYCFIKARDFFLKRNNYQHKKIVPTKLPSQTIYYGAPGTGKSYGINKNPNITDTNSFRTTFHPDSDYASFVGCYKPIMKEEYIEKRDLTEAQLIQILKERINDSNLKYPYHKFGFDYWRELTDYKTKDYEKWIKQCGGKPSMKTEISDSKILGEYAVEQIKNEISYKFAPQVFTKAYVKAYHRPDEQIYLIIEEINRGNCAQIFGDLFQLLDRNDKGESKYPIDAERDLRQYLEGILGENSSGINNGKLKLPANLNILATMNTSDQSLFPIDSAFKRRWDWIYIPICYEKTFTDIYGEEQVNRSYYFEIRIGGKKYRWIEFLKKVNDKIYLLTESEDKKMGNYFVDLPENETVIDEKVFKNKVMFYLWNDVCKDEKGNPQNFYKAADKEFSFNELFEDNASQLLDGFMTELDVIGEEIKKPD